MARITIDLDDELETALRSYIARSYVRPHGMIKKVIEDALRSYIFEEGLTDFVDNLDRTHAVLYSQDAARARKIELRWIQNNLLRGNKCFYLIPDGDPIDPADVLADMETYGMPIRSKSFSDRIVVVKVHDPRSNPKGIEAGVEGIFDGLTAGSDSPCTFVGRLIPTGDYSTDFAERVSLERSIESYLKRMKSSMLCSLDISKLQFGSSGKLFPELNKVHDDAIFLYLSKDVYFSLTAPKVPDPDKGRR